MTRQKDALDAAKSAVGSPLALRVLAAGVIWLLVPAALFPGSDASAVFGWIAVIDMIALILLSMSRTRRAAPRNPLDWFRDISTWTPFTLWLFFGPPDAEDSREVAVWRALFVACVALVASLIFNVAR